MKHLIWHPIHLVSLSLMNCFPIYEVCICRISSNSPNKYVPPPLPITYLTIWYILHAQLICNTFDSFTLAFFNWNTCVGGGGGNNFSLVMVLSKEVTTESTSALTSTSPFVCRPILYLSAVKLGIGRREEIFKLSSSLD